MKLVISGYRDFFDYQEFSSVVDSILTTLFVTESRFQEEDLEIISGGARGTDTLAETYARKKNIPFKEFPADWDLYGYTAGPIRNKEMAEYGDALLAFWHPKSKGTSNMISLAKEEKHGFTHVFVYDVTKRDFLDL